MSLSSQPLTVLVAETIKQLAERSTRTTDATASMQFTQAALNLAHALSIMVDAAQSVTDIKVAEAVHA